MFFAVPSEKYPYSTILKTPDVYKVYWKAVDDKMVFEVQVKTKGWVGFGLSPNGGMKGSDVVIGWVKDGKAYLEDRYAEGKTEPRLDRKQDWKLLWGKNFRSFTILKFERKLRTCDKDDRTIEVTQLYSVKSCNNFTFDLTFSMAL